MSALAILTSLLVVGGPRIEGLVSARDSLGGLNGFSVVVDVDAGAREAGIAAQALVTQARTALRRRGVHVYEYAGNRAIDEPGTPGKEGQLRVELVAVTGAAGGATFAAVRYDVAVSQWAQLEADPSAATFARTWMQGGVLTAARPEVTEVVREAVAAALDAFCTDYASARAFWLARERAKAATPKGE